MLSQEKEKINTHRPEDGIEQEREDTTEKRSALTSIAGVDERASERTEEGGGVLSFPHYVEGYSLTAEEEGEPEPPRLVIRGAHMTTPPPKTNKTVIDWLAFTSTETIAILQEFVTIFVPNALFFPQMKGWQGYKNHYSISVFGKNIGLLAYGGNNERPYLSITGDGCRLIEDWALVTHYLNTMEEVKITRCDIAADYYYGEVTREIVDNAYEEGKFILSKSSKNPMWDPRNPVSGDGVPKGWTRYVGKRTSGKFLRIYHKGLEQFGKLDPETQETFLKNWEDIEINGIYKAPEEATFKNWVRVEVEYSSKNRLLPIEIIEERDNYFSGSYPFLEEILPMTTPLRPKTLPNNLETEIEIMFNHIRNQYGSFFTTMLASGMTPEEILKKSMNGKLSQRIIKAGGLEVIKPYDPKCLEPKQSD